MRLHLAAAALAAALAAPGAALAHQPFFAEGTETGAESAFVFEDARVSRVVHVDARCPAEPFWGRISAERGDVLYVALGVPQMEELRDYRPTLYLVGPDLPAPESRPPFQIPLGYGALALPTDDVAAPRAFHEPFTRTDSWILVEQRHVVVRNASYYVVVDAPPVRGRFWVASGNEEEPGAEPGALARMRLFYSAASDPDLGSSCAEPAVELTGGGCAIAPASPPGAAPGAVLGLALAFALRRRRARRATALAGRREA